MSRKNRNVKFNPKLAHQQKIREINKGKRFNNKKSDFNRSERKPQMKNKRPGKVARQQTRGGKGGKH